MLALGGHPRVLSADQDPDGLVNDGRHGAWLPERFDAGTDTWTYMPGHWLYVFWGDVGEHVPPEGQSPPAGGVGSNYLYYPRVFVVPDGRVFLASRNDGSCGFYDPVTGLVGEPVIDPPPHVGTFAETNHTAVLLPLLPGDGYVARVLFLGTDGPSRIRLDGDPAPSWESTTERDWPADPPLRRHGCATLLPTGDVAFTGGIDNGGGSGLPDTDAVLAAEIYHPGFDWDAQVIDEALEEWTTVNPGATVARNYHSVALLLPNGRILTAGSNIDGAAGGDDDKEYRIEVFSPGYVDAPNRPEIIEAPSSLTWGEEFDVVTTRAGAIERVALMRCGSVTHAWDGDQRYVGLPFTWDGDDSPVLHVVAPPHGNVAPPGPYMLWVVDRLGRPCRLAPFVILT